MKVAPPRTSATRCGALTMRQRRWADSISLNAIASAAAFDPWPLVTFVRRRTVAKITGDEDELLAFYDYPAEHWVHLRTTNPIESTFATVRLRTKVTKGHGSKAAALAMAFKLIESAQRRWRMVNAPHLVALVRAGATIVNGKLIERPDDQPPAANSASPVAAREVSATAA